LVGIDRPGIYELETVDNNAKFAAHLDPLESDTAPLAEEAFEQTGIPLTAEFDAAAAKAKMQQMRDVELEGRQKVWKWLVATALVLLIVESLLAGWQSMPADTTAATA
jgi:hypothetical protein